MRLQEKRPGWFPVSFPLFVVMKEHHAMERTIKSDILFGVYRVERSPLTHPARDSLHERVPGYTCREEAIEACCAWNETCESTQNWRWLAALTEVYPERNAWYLDEIVRLTGGVDIPLLHHGLSVQAVVHARCKNGFESIAAIGDTPDEAIEALYKCVYEWSRMLQAAACARSKPPIS